MSAQFKKLNFGTTEYDLFFQRERNRNVVDHPESDLHAFQRFARVDLDRFLRPLLNGDVVVKNNPDYSMNCGSVSVRKACSLM